MRSLDRWTAILYRKRHVLLLVAHTIAEPARHSYVPRILLHRMSVCFCYHPLSRAPSTTRDPYLPPTYTPDIHLTARTDSAGARSGAGRAPSSTIHPFPRPRAYRA